MAFNVNIVIHNIDYDLLREQKLQLIKISNEYEKGKRIVLFDTLDGIINLLDAIQDAVVADGIKTKIQVFGEENNEEN